MAQKKLPEQFPVDSKTKIDDVWLRRLLDVLEARIGTIELKGADFDEATAQLLTIGLARINEIILPAIEEVQELSGLGFLVAHSQTPTTLILDQVTLLNIPAGTERNLFSPSTFVILTRDANVTDYAILRTTSYDKETGDYVGTIIDAQGNDGPFSDWTIAALAGSTTAQMDMLDESRDIRDNVTSLASQVNLDAGQVAADKSTVLSARTDAVNAASDSNTAKGLALAAATLAGRYANEPEDSPIAPGVYSTAHYLAKVTALYNAAVTQVAALIHGAASKLLPADTDELGLTDSAAGWVLKKLSMIRLKAYVAKEGFTAAFRNKVINGDFDFWQRGVSFSASGSQYTADRWYRSFNGTALTSILSLQTFALGQTLVPGNPKYYLRYAPTVVNLTEHSLQHPIESVATLSGKKATLTFWAQGGFTLPSVELLQFFGTGGAPSASVVVPIASNVAISAGFTKYTYSFDIPSVSGKVLGSNGNDRLALVFRFPLASAFTFDLAHVSLVEGDATNEADPFSARGFATEFAMCQRYYERSTGLRVFNSAAGSSVLRATWTYKVTKRTVPSLSVFVGAVEFVFADCATTYQTTSAASTYDTSTIIADAEF